MIAYSYDREGYFSGKVKRQENPLKPGDFFMPARATSEVPHAIGDPSLEENKWNGSSWEKIESRKSLEIRKESVKDEDERWVKKDFTIDEVEKSRILDEELVEKEAQAVITAKFKANSDAVKSHYDSIDSIKDIDELRLIIKDLIRMVAGIID